MRNLTASILTLRKAFLSWIAFSLGILFVAVWYAAFSSWLSTADRVTAWSPISSASWNRIVDALIELDARSSWMAYFESAELPANLGTASVSHGLWGKPKLWSVVLRCKTAEYNGLKSRTKFQGRLRQDECRC